MECDEHPSVALKSIITESAAKYLLNWNKRNNSSFNQSQSYDIHEDVTYSSEKREQWDKQYEQLIQLNTAVFFPYSEITTNDNNRDASTNRQSHQPDIGVKYNRLYRNTRPSTLSSSASLSTGIMHQSISPIRNTVIKKNSFHFLKIGPKTAPSILNGFRTSLELMKLMYAKSRTCNNINKKSFSGIRGACPFTMDWLGLIDNKAILTDTSSLPQRSHTITVQDNTGEHQHNQSSIKVDCSVFTAINFMMNLLVAYAGDDRSDLCGITFSSPICPVKFTLEFVSISVELHSVAGAIFQADNTLVTPSQLTAEFFTLLIQMLPQCVDDHHLTVSTILAANVARQLANEAHNSTNKSSDEECGSSDASKTSTASPENNNSSRKIERTHRENNREPSDLEDESGSEYSHYQEEMRSMVSSHTSDQPKPLHCLNGPTMALYRPQEPCSQIRHRDQNNSGLTPSLNCISVATVFQKNAMKEAALQALAQCCTDMVSMNVSCSFQLPIVGYRGEAQRAQLFSHHSHCSITLPNKASVIRELQVAQSASPSIQSSSKISKSLSAESSNCTSNSALIAEIYRHLPDVPLAQSPKQDTSFTLENTIFSCKTCLHCELRDCDGITQNVRAHPAIVLGRSAVIGSLQHYYQHPKDLLSMPKTSVNTDTHKVTVNPQSPPTNPAILLHERLWQIILSYPIFRELMFEVAIYRGENDPCTKEMTETEVRTKEETIETNTRYSKTRLDKTPNLDTGSSSFYSVDEGGASISRSVELLNRDVTTTSHDVNKENDTEDTPEKQNYDVEYMERICTPINKDEDSVNSGYHLEKNDAGEDTFRPGRVSQCTFSFSRFSGRQTFKFSDTANAVYHGIASTDNLPPTMHKSEIISSSNENSGKSETTRSSSTTTPQQRTLLRNALTALKLFNFTMSETTTSPISTYHDSPFPTYFTPLLYRAVFRGLLTNEPIAQSLVQRDPTVTDVISAALSLCIHLRENRLNNFIPLQYFLLDDKKEERRQLMEYSTEERDFMPSLHLSMMTESRHGEHHEACWRAIKEEKREIEMKARGGAALIDNQHRLPEHSAKSYQQNVSQQEHDDTVISTNPSALGRNAYLYTLGQELNYPGSHASQKGVRDIHMNDLQNVPPLKKKKSIIQRVRASAIAARAALTFPMWNMKSNRDRVYLSPTEKTNKDDEDLEEYHQLDEGYNGRRLSGFTALDSLDTDKTEPPIGAFGPYREYSIPRESDNNSCDGSFSEIEDNLGIENRGSGVSVAYRANKRGPSHSESTNSLEGTNSSMRMFNVTPSVISTLTPSFLARKGKPRTTSLNNRFDNNSLDRVSQSFTSHGEKHYQYSSSTPFFLFSFFNGEEPLVGPYIPPLPVSMERCFSSKKVGGSASRCPGSVSFRSIDDTVLSHIKMGEVSNCLERAYNGEASTDEIRWLFLLDMVPRRENGKYPIEEECGPWYLAHNRLKWWWSNTAKNVKTFTNGQTDQQQMNQHFTSIIHAHFFEFPSVSDLDDCLDNLWGVFEDPLGVLPSTGDSRASFQQDCISLISEQVTRIYVFFLKCQVARSMMLTNAISNLNLAGSSNHKMPGSHSLLPAHIAEIPFTTCIVNTVHTRLRVLNEQRLLSATDVKIRDAELTARLQDLRHKFEGQGEEYTTIGSTNKERLFKEPHKHKNNNLSNCETSASPIIDGTNVNRSPVKNLHTAIMDLKGEQKRLRSAFCGEEYVSALRAVSILYSISVKELITLQIIRDEKKRFHVGNGANEKNEAIVSRLYNECDPDQLISSIVTGMSPMFIDKNDVLISFQSLMECLNKMISATMFSKEESNPPFRHTKGGSRSQFSQYTTVSPKALRKTTWASYVLHRLLRRHSFTNTATSSIFKSNTSLSSNRPTILQLAVADASQALSVSTMSNRNLLKLYKRSVEMPSSLESQEAQDNSISHQRSTFFKNREIISGEMLISERRLKKKWVRNIIHDLVCKPSFNAISQASGITVFSLYNLSISNSDCSCVPLTPSSAALSALHDKFITPRRFQFQWTQIAMQFIQDFTSSFRHMEIMSGISSRKAQRGVGGDRTYSTSVRVGTMLTQLDVLINTLCTIWCGNGLYGDLSTNGNHTVLVALLQEAALVQEIKVTNVSEDHQSETSRCSSCVRPEVEVEINLSEGDESEKKSPNFSKSILPKITYVYPRITTSPDPLQQSSTTFLRKCPFLGAAIKDIENLAWVNSSSSLTNLSSTNNVLLQVQLNTLGLKDALIESLFFSISRVSTLGSLAATSHTAIIAGNAANHAENLDDFFSLKNANKMKIDFIPPIIPSSRRSSRTITNYSSTSLNPLLPISWLLSRQARKIQHWWLSLHKKLLHQSKCKVRGIHYHNKILEKYENPTSKNRAHTSSQTNCSANPPPEVVIGQFLGLVGQLVIPLGYYSNTTERTVDTLSYSAASQALMHTFTSPKISTVVHGSLDLNRGTRGELQYIANMTLEDITNSLRHAEEQYDSGVLDCLRTLMPAYEPKAMNMIKLPSTAPTMLKNNAHLEYIIAILSQQANDTFTNIPDKEQNERGKTEEIRADLVVNRVQILVDSIIKCDLLSTTPIPHGDTVSCSVTAGAVCDLPSALKPSHVLRYLAYFTTKIQDTLNEGIEETLAMLALARLHNNTSRAGTLEDWLGNLNGDSDAYDDEQMARKSSNTNRNSPMKENIDSSLYSESIHSHTSHSSENETKLLSLHTMSLPRAPGVPIATLSSIHTNSNYNAAFEDIAFCADGMIPGTYRATLVAIANSIIEHIVTPLETRVARLIQALESALIASKSVGSQLNCNNNKNSDSIYVVRKKQEVFALTEVLLSDQITINMLLNHVLEFCVHTGWPAPKRNVVIPRNVKGSLQGSFGFQRVNIFLSLGRVKALSAEALIPLLTVVAKLLKLSTVCETSTAGALWRGPLDIPFSACTLSTDVISRTFLQSGKPLNNSAVQALEKHYDQQRLAGAEERKLLCLAQRVRTAFFAQEITSQYMVYRTLWQLISWCDIPEICVLGNNVYTDMCVKFAKASPYASMKPSDHADVAHRRHEADINRATQLSTSSVITAVVATEKLYKKLEKIPIDSRCGDRVHNNSPNEAFVLQYAVRSIATLSPPLLRSSSSHNYTAALSDSEILFQVGVGCPVSTVIRFEEISTNTSSAAITDSILSENTVATRHRLSQAIIRLIPQMNSLEGAAFAHIFATASRNKFKRTLHETSCGPCASDNDTSDETAEEDTSDNDDSVSRDIAMARYDPVTGLNAEEALHFASSIEANPIPLLVNEGDSDKAGVRNYLPRLSHKELLLFKAITDLEIIRANAAPFTSSTFSTALLSYSPYEVRGFEMNVVPFTAALTLLLKVRCMDLFLYGALGDNSPVKATEEGIPEGTVAAVVKANMKELIYRAYNSSVDLVRTEAGQMAFILAKKFPLLAGEWDIVSLLITALNALQYPDMHISGNTSVRVAATMPLSAAVTGELNPFIQTMGYFVNVPSVDKYNASSDDYHNQLKGPLHSSISSKDTVRFHVFKSFVRRWLKLSLRNHPQPVCEAISRCVLVQGCDHSVVTTIDTPPGITIAMQTIDSMATSVCQRHYNNVQKSSEYSIHRHMTKYYRLGASCLSPGSFCNFSQTLIKRTAALSKCSVFLEKGMANGSYLLEDLLQNALDQLDEVFSLHEKISLNSIRSGSQKNPLAVTEREYAFLKQGDEICNIIAKTAESLYFATAALVLCGDVNKIGTSTTSCRRFSDDLLKLLVMGPIQAFTPLTIHAAVECWRWLITFRSELSTTILSLVVEGFGWTISSRLGLFDGIGHNPMENVETNVADNEYCRKSQNRQNRQVTWSQETFPNYAAKRLYASDYDSNSPHITIISFLGDHYVGRNHIFLSKDILEYLASLVRQCIEAEAALSRKNSSFSEVMRLVVLLMLICRNLHHRNLSEKEDRLNGSSVNMTISNVGEREEEVYGECFLPLTEIALLRRGTFRLLLGWYIRGTHGGGPGWYHTHQVVSAASDAHVLVSLFQLLSQEEALVCQQSGAGFLEFGPRTMNYPELTRWHSMHLLRNSMPFPISDINKFSLDIPLHSPEYFIYLKPLESLNEKELIEPGTSRTTCASFRECETKEFPTEALMVQVNSILKCMKEMDREFSKKESQSRGGTSIRRAVSYRIINSFVDNKTSSPSPHVPLSSHLDKGTIDTVYPVVTLTDISQRATPMVSSVSPVGGRFPFHRKLIRSRPVRYGQSTTSQKISVNSCPGYEHNLVVDYDVALPLFSNKAARDARCHIHDLIGLLKVLVRNDHERLRVWTFPGTDSLSCVSGVSLIHFPRMPNGVPPSILQRDPHSESIKDNPSCGEQGLCGLCFTTGNRRQLPNYNSNDDFSILHRSSKYIRAINDIQAKKPIAKDSSSFFVSITEGVWRAFIRAAMRDGAVEMLTALVDRFPVSNAVSVAVSKTIRANPLAFVNYPTALEYLIKRTSDDSPSNLPLELSFWTNCGIIQALHYLSIRYSSSNHVVQYALRSILSADTQQLIFYLPQIIQCLRFAKINDISDLLKEHCRKNVEFAHQLLWSLNTEGGLYEGEMASRTSMGSSISSFTISRKVTIKQEQEHQQQQTFAKKCVLLMGEIISDFTPVQQSFFEKEFQYIKEIITISENLKAVEKGERKAELRRKLREGSDLYERPCKEDLLYLPTDPDQRIVGILADTAGAMQSSAKCPILVQFKCVDRPRTQICIEESSPRVGGYHKGNNSNRGRKKDNNSDSETIAGKSDISMKTTKNENTAPQAWKLIDRAVVKGCIFKFGDDCRQDQIAIQLIELFKRIFNQVGVPFFLYPYRVVTTAPDCGVIECVPNSISRHDIGKLVDGNIGDYFIQHHGHPKTSAQFAVARECFIKSMASYSVVSYILNIKDRHNANIMIDKEGHVIHIDFGFLFDFSPGGDRNFESAPFKLTLEMLELMGDGKMDKGSCQDFPQMSRVDARLPPSHQRKGFGCMKRGGKIHSKEKYQSGGRDTFTSGGTAVGNGVVPMPMNAFVKQQSGRQASLHTTGSMSGSVNNNSDVDVDEGIPPKLQQIAHNKGGNTLNKTNNAAILYSPASYAFFVESTVRCFLAAREYTREICVLVELMLGSGLPCFKPMQTIANLSLRMGVGLQEAEAAKLMRDHIINSRNNLRTNIYDYIQRMQNKIEM